jgi:dihydroorotase
MDPDFKMYPPLRAEADRVALVEGLVDGTIDAVATDHAPHAAADCEVPFEEAPRGVIGLETAVSAVLASTALGQEALFERMSSAPARIAGLDRHGAAVTVGAPGNLTVIDPAAQWVAGRFASRSQNSPWKGRNLTGRVVATVFEGAVTHALATTVERVS